MSTEGEQEFGEGEKFAEAELGENFAEAAVAVGEPEIEVMGENGDLSSPAPPLQHQAVETASSSEPRLLWSAYRSFHAIKCRLNSPAVKGSICV